MTGNRDIERELQTIEAEYASQGGQQAGFPRLRGLRGAIEVEVRRLERERDAAVALLRDGAVLIRGYGDGKYPDYPEGLLVAIDKWLARLDAFLAGVARTEPSA